MLAQTFFIELRNATSFFPSSADHRQHDTSCVGGGKDGANRTRKRPAGSLQWRIARAPHTPFFPANWLPSGHHFYMNAAKPNQNKNSQNSGSPRNSEAGGNSSSSESKARDASHHGSLLVIFLTVFIDLLGFGLVIPLLPIYGDRFATDPSGLQLGMLMAIFSIMQFIFAPMWGSLSDRIGRRPVLMIGLGGSALFYALFAYATFIESLPLLFLTRLGQGITGATIPTAQAYIADSTSPQNRQKGMALIGMAFGLGFTLGPLFGFLAISAEQDKMSILPGVAASLLSGIAFLLACFMLPESLRPESKPAGRKWLDTQGLSIVRRTPSVAGLLLAIFVCVFSFAAFETTLSLLIKGTSEQIATDKSPFEFSLQAVCGTFALIGLILALIQGGIVRPLSRRLPEAFLATVGAALEVVGFLIVAWAIAQASVPLLFTALTVIVSGFACMQPSLNSLLSRRTDPSYQGSVLGIGQSTNALARIFGSAIGIPLLKVWLPLPFVFSSALMAAGALLVLYAVRSGKDFEEAAPSALTTTAEDASAT